MTTHGHVVIVLRHIGQDSTAGAHFSRLQENGYTLHYIHPGQNALPAIDQVQPFVICFQFDHPDLRGLAELRLTKERLPAIPLLMITHGHSESLAVWAFRTRVWDYFIQPVDLERFLAVIDKLAEFRAGPEHGPSSPCNSLTLTNKIPSYLRVRGDDPHAHATSLEMVVSFVERNLHRKIPQTEAAELCSLSPFQFSRIFKRKYKLTFQEYVLRKRISEAMKMLHHPGATVGDVCFNVGFNDPSYFARTFQRYVGESPSHYRLSAMNRELTSPPTDFWTTGGPGNADHVALPVET